MSNAVRSRSDGPPAAANTGSIVAAVLAIWLTAVVFMGAAGAFVTPPGRPPLPLLGGVMVPVVVFFAAEELADVFDDVRRRHAQRLRLAVAGMFATGCAAVARAITEARRAQLVARANAAFTLLAVAATSTVGELGLVFVQAEAARAQRQHKRPKWPGSSTHDRQIYTRLRQRRRAHSAWAFVSARRTWPARFIGAQPAFSWRWHSNSTMPSATAKLRLCV